MKLQDLFEKHKQVEAALKGTARTIADQLIKKHGKEALDALDAYVKSAGKALDFERRTTLKQAKELIQAEKED
jgi:hypothetical protein